MSLYNLIHGVNPCTFFILPMLGSHPDEYPRFRDCFLSDEEHPEYNDHILVYTRVGGNNRGDGYGEEKLMSHPNFVATYDDSFDSTFGMYVFSVPNEWRIDFDHIKGGGGISGVSLEYQAQMRKVFPKLNETFDKLFAQVTPAEAKAAEETLENYGDLPEPNRHTTTQSDDLREEALTQGE